MQTLDRPIREVFAHRVKARRLNLGLTQAEVAERLGVSQGYYAQIENNRKNPGIDILDRIAIALDTSPERLVKRG